jgi:hypothetical protein
MPNEITETIDGAILRRPVDFLRYLTTLDDAREHVGHLATTRRFLRRRRDRVFSACSRSAKPERATIWSGSNVVR